MESLPGQWGVSSKAFPLGMSHVGSKNPDSNPLVMLRHCLGAALAEYGLSTNGATDPDMQQLEVLGPWLSLKQLP